MRFAKNMLATAACLFGATGLVGTAVLSTTARADTTDVTWQTTVEIEKLGCTLC